MGQILPILKEEIEFSDKSAASGKPLSMNAERFLVEYLSPARREALISPPSLGGKGAGELAVFR